MDESFWHRGRVGERKMEHDLENLRDQVRKFQKLIVQAEVSSGETKPDDRLLWDCIEALLDGLIELRR